MYTMLTYLSLSLWLLVASQPLRASYFSGGETIENLLTKNFMQLEYQSITAIYCSEKLTDKIVKRFCKGIPAGLCTIYRLDLSKASNLSEASLKEIVACEAFRCLTIIDLTGTKLQNEECFKLMLESGMGSLREYVQISGQYGVPASVIRLILDEDIYKHIKSAGQLNDFVNKNYTITYPNQKKVQGIKRLEFTYS